MTKRRGIGTKILNYIFILIILLFLVIVTGFNVAVRSFAVTQLKDQLTAAGDTVADFETAVSLPKGQGRNSMMEKMFRVDLSSTEVRILFLDENKNLTYQIAQSPLAAQSGEDTGNTGNTGNTGSMGNMGNTGSMGNMGGQSSTRRNQGQETNSGSGSGGKTQGGKTQGGKTQGGTTQSETTQSETTQSETTQSETTQSETTQSETTPDTTPIGDGSAVMTGTTMLLGKQAYAESLQVLDYIRADDSALTDYDYTKITSGDNSFFLKSIPFGDEYILAFIAVKTYDSFIRSTIRILFGIMLIMLLISYFIVKYLANQIAEPIKQLENLSRKIGSGDFAGETYDFKEEELQDLNQSLNDTAKKLKEYHDNQTIFFQSVSHELRTPLTSIKGYAEGIKYGVFAGEEAGEVILKESARLEKLVEDILYLSRLESDEPLNDEKTEMKLSELLWEAKDRALNEARIAGKEISCGFDQDLDLFISSEELQRAITNLLSNAIRYAAGKVTLRGSVEGDHLLIQVTDDGPGIEPEIAGSLFGRFSKGKSGQHGIGLSITKAAVEMHGGRVFAENMKPGSRFTISLPIAGITR